MLPILGWAAVAAVTSLAGYAAKKIYDEYDDGDSSSNSYEQERARAEQTERERREQQRAERLKQQIEALMVAELVPIGQRYLTADFQAPGKLRHDLIEAFLELEDIDDQKSALHGLAVLLGRKVQLKPVNNELAMLGKKQIALQQLRRYVSQVEAS